MCSCDGSAAVRWHGEFGYPDHSTIPIGTTRSGTGIGGLNGGVSLEDVGIGVGATA